MKITTKSIAAAFALCLAPLSSCLDEGDETIILEGNRIEDGDMSGNLLNVPDDADAGYNPSVVTSMFTMAGGITPTVDVVDGKAYATLHLPGIYKVHADGWLRLYGTSNPQQNVWVSVDGEPKGIAVVNVADRITEYKPAIDVVFLIDNSPKMGEEADAIAAQVLDWATGIQELGIDIRMGCVGYGGDSHAISGALNLTTPQIMDKYLDNGTGVERTKHFAGNDAESLMTIALGSDRYENGLFHECGVLAMRFAHDNFAFRDGANRIYVNFTDEANQPNGDAGWSVEYLNPDNGNWTAADGTVHVVYSGSEGVEYNTSLYEEWPGLMATYTGGEEMYVDSDARFLRLQDLRFTGSISNSYLIRFGNITRYLDGRPHRVHITVNDGDYDYYGYRIYDMIFK